MAYIQVIKLWKPSSDGDEPKQEQRETVLQVHCQELDFAGRFVLLCQKRPIAESIGLVQLFLEIIVIVKNVKLIELIRDFVV